MTEQLTAEELEEWRAHPVTERILTILRKGCAQNKASLQAQLWASGSCDPATLGRVKASEELIEDLSEGTHDDWNDWQKHFDQR